MTHLRKLSVLIVPLAFGVALATAPGRAQPGASGRFAFADTTLLRDTLGLHFDRLFPVADSLAMLPDTLRALSIRYRYTIDRLLWLSDSLGMPVDSVGGILLRERFNPLASGVRRSNSFTYNSGYTISETSDSWSNGADYNLIYGSVFLRNNTLITIDTYRSKTRTSYQETRGSETETGWKFSPNFSAGARANISRFDNNSQGSVLNESETKGEYQLSLRSRQQEARGISSELNYFAGLLDVNNVSLEKRGLLSDLNGRLRVTRGSWLTHDLQGQINGNFAKSTAPDTIARVNTKDRSRNLRGTLGLLPSAPASVNIGYNYRDVRVENPAPKDSLIRGIAVQQVNTKDRGVDMSLRLRRDNDRYINVSERLSSREQASSVSLTAQNKRNDEQFSTTGRWFVRPITLDGSFNIGDTDSRYPRRSVSGGYVENAFTRSVDGTLTWPLTRRLVMKLNGNVNLSSYRYTVIDSFNPPVPRDFYRQTWSTNALYNPSQRFNTNLGLEVGRSQYVNIPATSAASNNEVRTYRADWRWTFRLTEGLTATQRNQLTADYSYFHIETNNRLSLDYSTYTTLNAVLTPRLTIDVNHTARYQPSGNYIRFEDGLYYLTRSDETHTYSLDARVSYAPGPGVSINVRPQYYATDRDGTVEGESVPQRKGRTLSFLGGASLNIPVGARGKLSGDINRSFRSDQTTAYTLGVPKTSPVAEQDYWVGSLQFTWDLQ